MFSFNQDDLMYQIYSNQYQQDFIQQDLIPEHVAIGDGSNINLVDYANPVRSPRRVNKVSASNLNNNFGDHTGKRKMMHRDLERQRRQEMAALFSSLRSLLPYEYLKGKRSTSDQVNQARIYIKDTQNRVSELAAKRDKLKVLSNPAASFPQSADASSYLPKGSLVVKSYMGGFEIIYSRSNEQEQHFPLSKVLNLVVNEGLHIVDCVSTRVHDKLISTIHPQVSDSAKIDQSGLERKLSEAILSARSVSN